MKKIKFPDIVKCVKEFHSDMYPDTDFGVLNRNYEVNRIVPNGCYYVLRGLGKEGAPNHFVNAERFVPISYTEVELWENM